MNKYIGKFSFIFASVFFLFGCGVDKAIELKNKAVIPFTAGYPLILDAKEITMILTNAGLTKAEILELGVDIRRALAVQGGASIKVGSETVAVIGAFEGVVYISSARKGNTIINLS